MIETDSVQEILSIIRKRGFGRIGVDGTNKAGKTTMSTKLANELGFSHLNLDDYLEKNKGGFLEFLKYQDIKQDLSELDNFVIDGVCLLKVLGHIDTPIEVLIYVKRMRHGLWADETECEVEGDVEKYIKKEKETIRLIEGTEEPPDTLGLAEEIISYHAEYGPQSKADIIYKRNNC